MESDRITDAREHGDAPIVGIVCGRCLHEAVADRVPTFCGMCRARFDRGDPHASVHFGTIVEGTTIGFGVSARLHGVAWSDEAFEHVRALVE